MGLQAVSGLDRGSVRVVPRPVRGLLFGMSNVLYDATLWRRWLLQLLRRLGLHTSYQAFYHVLDRDYLAPVQRGERDFCEAFRSFLAAMGLSRGQIEEVEAACEARRRCWEAQARPLPGVRATLRKLHAARLMLGVVSNSEHPAEVLRGQLDQLGLQGLFATVVSSRDLGYTKPHPLPYLTALRTVHLKPYEAAFVGQSAEELAGAAALGMVTVAFNYQPEAEADVYLDSFDQLLDAVSPSKHYARTA